MKYALLLMSFLAATLGHATTEITFLIQTVFVIVLVVAAAVVHIIEVKHKK